MSLGAARPGGGREGSLLTVEGGLWVNSTSLCLQENLSEIRQENVKLTFKQQLVHFSAHLAAWVVSTGVAIACCVAVYYLAENNSEVSREAGAPASRGQKNKGREGVAEGEGGSEPTPPTGWPAASAQVC